MDDDWFSLDPPLYLVAGETGCWRCHADMPVVAILCANSQHPDEGPYILSDTLGLPADLLSFVQRRRPTYRLTFSKTVGAKYYANNCPQCGVISGDFYLHSEPGAPFFPTDSDDAALLTIEPIPMDHECFVRSGCGYGTGEMILEHARRIGPTSTHNDMET